MKRLLAVFLCLCQPSWGAIAFVHGTIGNGGATPQSLTVPSTAPGNLIVVGIVGSPQTSTVNASGVTDNAAGGSNTYVQATNARGATNATNDLFSDIWYCYNAKSATSISVALTAASTIGMIAVYEFSGAGVGTFDVANSAVTNTAAATIVGPGITTAVSGEVIVTACADTDGVASVSAPYNTNALTNTNGHAAAYHITTTPVTNEKCTFNDSATGAGVVSAAALEPAGSSTGIPNNLFLIKGGRIAMTGSMTSIK